MSVGKFSSSPREEALEIALQTRRDVLSKEPDPAIILRACLVIAHDLGKKTVIDWINKELSGYAIEEVPDYRVQSCPVFDGFVNNDLLYFRDYKINFPVHYLTSHSKRNQPLKIDWNEEGEEHCVLIVSTEKMDSILAVIVDRCCQFLNETISELQFGGIVEYLMEEIRKKTDEKLATVDARIADETQSLYLNLTSTNPADWSKVGHSSRKILKLLADYVFPSSNEKYVAKDKKEYIVTDPCFVNRLNAFLDKVAAAEEKNFVETQLDYFDSYLRQVVNYAQMAEHNPSIDRFHANMLAIHLYLVCSEILKYVGTDSPIEQASNSQSPN
ncbi:MAG: hypothetical protein ACE14S_10815 [Candidatus Bathyarchaeia archaeon]